MSNSSLIIESAVFQQPEIVSQKPNKVIFRIQLQSCDDVNQNSRIYPRRVLEESMTECYKRMQNRAFLGELDHPGITGNDEIDGSRQTTILLKEASHIIRDFQFEGNKLYGEMESLQTPNGKILHSLLESRVGIGVSMRGMASLEKNREGNNVVQSPLVIIGYDAVSNPSHKESVVNFSEMKFESKSLISESSSTVCFNGKCYLPDYFDKLIETKVFQFYKAWV